MIKIKLDDLIKGRYKIKEVIGNGGFAIVYLATDLKYQRDVAIKVLNVEQLKDLTLSLKRFKRESELASKEKSEYLVRIYDVFSDGENECIVQEYVKGKTLKDKIVEHTSLHYIEAINIILQICKGVRVIHRNNIIHRDLKPENILITDSGQIKITDFGIALLEGGSNQYTKAGNVVGTTKYMAPELLVSKTREDSAKNITPRADIYSLGILLYEMIRGENPIPGNPIDAFEFHMKKTLPSIKKYNSSVPIAVDHIIANCTRKNKEDRYRSVESLIDDLTKAKHSAEINQHGDGKYNVSRFWNKKFRHSQESDLPWYAKRKFINLYVLLLIICVATLVIIIYFYKTKKF